MNRRRFFGTLFGLAVAPAVAVKVLSAPTHKVYRDKHTGLAPFKGRTYFTEGVIYAPYIPLMITSDLVKDLKPRSSFEQYYSKVKIYGDEKLRL